MLFVIMMHEYTPDALLSSQIIFQEDPDSDPGLLCPSRCSTELHPHPRLKPAADGPDSITN